MPVYMIVEIHVTEPQKYARYVEAVRKTVEGRRVPTVVGVQRTWPFKGTIDDFKSDHS